MNLLTAWQDLVFRTYVWIIGGILGGAGAILLVLRLTGRKNLEGVFRTYRSWLVMAPLALLAIGAGRSVTLAFFGLLAILAVKEFSRATGLYRDWWMTGGVYLGVLGVFFIAWLPDPNNGHPGWYGLYMAMPVYVVASLILIPVLRYRVQGQLQAISLGILAFIYMGWMFGHAGFMANSPHRYGYLLYLLFAVELNDVTAFTCGKIFGRHPFRSNISPKKTWEGAAGAFCVSMALPWAFRFSFPHFGALQLVLTGLIVGVGGQLGDLAISVIKRDIGIKDMGGVIPGHGGILDRVDSLIYTAPLFLHMTNFFYKHW
jgi:phosphatidate cytidylyltransferase